MKSSIGLFLFLILCIFLLSSCDKVEVSVAPSDGLILYLPFDADVYDSSGKNNDCINYTSEKYVKGKRGNGLDFNGTSDYLQLTNTLNSSNGLSFSFWIKSRGANGIENNGVIISKIQHDESAKMFHDLFFRQRNSKK